MTHLILCLNKKFIISFILLAFLAAGNLSGASSQSVKSVMERVISDLYKTTSQQELAKLDAGKVMTLFTKEELKVLSTCHWKFTVSVPVVVSLMVSTDQKTLPFWIEGNGFKKTSLSMKNEQTTYEVWQKSFAPGVVGLGVNGFENGLALHYFVSVAPQRAEDQLALSNFYPENQQIVILRNGASVYQDWDELVLTDVPEALAGHNLLMTTRGRASESHLVGAFRSTPYPSSAVSDQVVLTWSADPSSTMDIQWRSGMSVNEPNLRYRVKNTTEELSLVAEKRVLEDRMLMNDRYTNRYTARLTNLKQGTTYQYQTGPRKDWSEAAEFKVPAMDSTFSFLWFGDTHYSAKFGAILQKGFSEHPDAAFFSIVGDLVSDGLNRDQWDALFHYTSEAASKIPFMAVPGNHDNRAGLGARLYCDLFSYPLNGPEGVPQEQTYSFTYKNALFLMIDATSPIETQSAWIEKQLAGSKATWKIAMFHFAPYNWEEPYLDIQKAWVPIFDRYHVDMVFGGHLHYYMRSKPMKGGKIAASYKDGTAYIISVGIPNSGRPMTEEPYAFVRDGKGHLYQSVKIEGNTLTMESVNMQGKTIDSITLKK